MEPRIVVGYAQTDEIEPRSLIKAPDLSVPFVVRKTKRLTPDEIADIQKLLSHTSDKDLKEIAAAFQVSATTIRRIHKRKAA